MEGQPTVRIRLSSAVAVDLAGGTLTGQALGSRKARTLLALLAAERGRPVPIDRIVETLWPEQQPADPAANVATLVSRTRRLLGPDVITGSGRTYGLTNGGRWRVDLDEAARFGAQAATRVGAGEYVLGAAAARAALDLLGTQPALVDEDDADWVAAVRREADGLRRTAAHHLAVALTVLDPAAAVRVATDSTTRDPFDERAVRDLMRAFVADGRSTAGLAVYDGLVRRLRDELGTAPDRATSELHVALLRESDLPPERPTRAPRAERVMLLGREPELSRVEQSWTAVGGTQAQPLLLVVGEAGIGKTRLLDAVAELADRTGGTVLRGRCHPAERSLFLQPYVDALRPTLLGTSADALADLVRDHAAAWVSLVPELAVVLPGTPPLPADVDLQRRQAYDAVAGVLRRLSRDRPVLLAIDDLQEGGAATIDLLGYLAGRLVGARVLLVAALRSENAALADQLADRSTRLPLSPLPRSAVDALAAAAGLAGRGEQVMARTAGHSLSVVEYLRALAAGDAGVPDSLADAVLTRVGRLDEDTRAVVEAAAVLRHRLDPRMVAALVEASELATTRRCEELARVRLLVRSDDRYEFSNDLLQECVYAALAPALAIAYHRRAADLTSDQPEIMAEHAYAAGDQARAALGWLLAGETALRRSAVEDARGLIDRSLSVSSASPDVRARGLLAHARVHEAEMQWDPAIADIDAALGLARTVGDRRLQMAALRARGGDAAVGARRPDEELARHIEDGLQLAAGLGDRRAEADFAGRLSVLEASHLRLTSALARAEQAVARARTAGSADGVVFALDGLKTVWWYLGDPQRLAAVIAELEPLLRDRGETWLLQWVVFESALVPAARDDWAEAAARMADAKELNRRSGFPAYAGFIQAYEGWFARLAGDLDRARWLGRQAVAVTESVGHPWWYASAAGFLAATLIETGEYAEADAVARRGLAVHPSIAPAGRLGCVAALAALADDDAVVEATRLLGAVDCPPGTAWVLGADSYLLVARAVAERGDTDEAARVVAPLEAATTRTWAAVRDRLVPYSSSTTSAAARSAPSLGTGT